MAPIIITITNYVEHYDTRYGQRYDTDSGTIQGVTGKKAHSNSIAYFDFFERILFRIHMRKLFGSEP